MIRRGTFQPDAKHLAISHAAEAIPGWMLDEVQERCKDKRGRPRKHRDREPELVSGAAAIQGAVHKKKEKQKKGGGGAWRAFIHVRMAGYQLTKTQLQKLSAEYAGLSAAEKAKFEALGAAGLWWEQILRCLSLEKGVLAWRFCRASSIPCKW